MLQTQMRMYEERSLPHVTLQAAFPAAADHEQEFCSVMCTCPHRPHEVQWTQRNLDSHSHSFNACHRHPREKISSAR